MTTTPGTGNDRVTPLLKGALPPALIVGALAIVGAVVFAGLKGGIGALLGVAIVVLFSGTGLLAMRLVRTQEPLLVMTVAMASYFFRILVFGALLFVTGMVSGIDNVIDRRATALTVVVCMIAWMIGEIRAFTKLRIPTYDVELPKPESGS